MASGGSTVETSVQRACEVVRDEPAVGEQPGEIDALEGGVDMARYGDELLVELSEVDARCARHALRLQDASFI
ncbi:hypothetical protein C5L38_34365 (plasmid) [Streptomyces sp. WAC00288]|nr:hypothetical protein C5L38_34365 [Streptomyces sp. WAC00288]KYG51201.1 hypothetical protein AWI43_32765 [Streptomyces sp. WAC04657]